MKTGTIIGLLFVGYVAYVYLDQEYFGVYRNSRVVDVVILSSSDTLYHFKNLQPGQFKFRQKECRVELSDLKTDTANYVMLNLKIQSKPVNVVHIDEYQDNKVANTTEYHF